MKNIIAVVIGVSFLVFAGMSGAASVTSLPGGTVIPIPGVGYIGSGPQNFDGIIWTSTTSQSSFGFSANWVFEDNGTWDGSLGPMAGVGSYFGGSESMTFVFDTPVSGVGGFINYYHWDGYPFDIGIPVISVYDSSSNLIESQTLNWDTGGADNSGEFHGFLEGSAIIKSFTLSNAFIGVVNLTTTSPVPIPSTLLLLGSGVVGLVGIGRRKFKK